MNRARTLGDLGLRKATAAALLLGVLGAALSHRLGEPISVTEDRDIDVPFDQSMKGEDFPSVLEDESNAALYGFLRTLYEENSLRNTTVRSAPTIPTLVHLIWLGGRLPSEYERFVQSWYDHHPRWTILFWTDSSANFDRGSVVRSFDELSRWLEADPVAARMVIDTSNLEFDNRPFFDQATNYGERSDILKWEIVYRYGGLYVDVDFESLKPIDTFHERYDFYTGIQPLDTGRVQLGAALFGARPLHPILKRCVEGIRENQHLRRIIARTGPLHFTQAFRETAGVTDDSIEVAMPASYFYPCDYEERSMAEPIWRKEESFAVHHWAGSWLKPEAFVPKVSVPTVGRTPGRSGTK